LDLLQKETLDLTGVEHKMARFVATGIAHGCKLQNSVSYFFPHCMSYPVIFLLGN